MCRSPCELPLDGGLARPWSPVSTACEAVEGDHQSSGHRHDDEVPDQRGAQHGCHASARAADVRRNAPMCRSRAEHIGRQSQSCPVLSSSRKEA